MTPDQLPPGLRVKPLEWERAKGIPDEIWNSRNYTVGRYPFDDGQWHFSLHNPLQRTQCESLSAAKAACQRHHEEQVCAQLEIVNG